MMLNMSHLFGTEDKLLPVSPNEVEVCAEERHFPSVEDTSDTEFNELCDIVFNEHGWSKPGNPEEAVYLYHQLRNEIRQILELSD